MKFYTGQEDKYAAQLVTLKSRYNTISMLRFFAAVAFIILGYVSLRDSQNTMYLVLMGVCLIAFIYLMKLHTTVAKAKVSAAALVAINQEEIAYLKRETIPFENGVEFIDFKHPYSYDLDIFGDHSLFQNINRTQTFKGKETLANLLLTTLPHDEILQNQEAIKELAAKPEWRQEVMALGRTGNDSQHLYSKLINWSSRVSAGISLFVNIVSYLSPVVLLGLLVAYFISSNNQYLTYAGYVFSFNVMFFFSRSKMISEETSNTTEIYAIIERYSIIIEQIESEKFTTARLQEIQKRLLYKDLKASTHIKQLAELFSRMDTIGNVFAAVVFNGLFFFHIHTLRSLLKWKREHAENVKHWLEVIGQAEALSSLGNLYFNNPDFTLPELNNNHIIYFKQLAHPLLNPATRVGNDVHFNPQFMVLTGSNMSGKSTFLRSLGINMVLAGIGAPVCAGEAVVHPLPVLVSMRLSDSLSDSESYFFAEIKRLKLIMDELEGQRAFVLLDEILRGTNSDDKRTGTIEVVKKMIDKKAIGAIATHDIEVCNTTFEYPEQLTNQCFEVQIVNNDLYFDYKLREGICKNKSATFLMEKMGVI